MDAHFGPVAQLGYAVHAVEPWIERYVAAGVGPWWVFRALAADRYIYRGAPTAARFDCAITWSGPLMIEIIVPIDRAPSPYRDFLDAGREGLQHVCYFPDDFEAASAALRRQDLEEIVDGHTGGFAYRYFARPGAGDAIELGHLSEETRATHGKLRALCAAWDGHDPIRGAYDLR